MEVPKLYRHLSNVDFSYTFDGEDAINEETLTIQAIHLFLDRLWFLLLVVFLNHLHDDDGDGDDESSLELSNFHLNLRVEDWSFQLRNQLDYAKHLKFLP